eukprot:TRINITY_DN19243_c0_g1_i1.p1 TRINITY_DN19243_c0_g1~~TRINITY_DN19243_c0_g1_i1.p1  ORF type:complete len:291 (-),score=11.16 TRINITY_DN19243_c0_g1_i1:371-1243(-)
MDRTQIQRQQQAQGSGSIVSTVFQRNKRKLIGLSCLYAVGLYLAFFATGIPVSEAGLQKYEVKMIEVEQLHASREWKQTMLQLSNIEFELYNAKVWFWWFRPEARQQVRYLQREYNEAKYQARELIREEEQLKRQARGFLGLWSHRGVKDSKAMFWQSFEQGKVFAKRQTMWDAIFTLLSRREEDWLIQLLQLVFIAIINFTTGMFLSAVLYLVGLPKLIWSYNAGWVSGLGFFMVSFLGAFAVIVSFLLALYGAGFVFVYTVAKNVEQRRLAGAYRSNRRINYNHRHYE